jgi:hypothetical protein
MKFLKRFLLILVGIIAIALIAALFVDGDISIKKEVVINKPKQQVFDYIKLLKNQNEYSVWNKMDPNMKQSYTGTDGTVGFISAWEGNSDVGKGAQTITAIVEGEKLETDLHFIKPWESHSKAFMTTSAVTDSTTTVSWGFNSKMPYPMNLMCLFTDMKKMLGEDYDKGLASLKTTLEK